MRVSIAMCTYNGAPYLLMQLRSFAVQTHAPYELVVCDDGSTDGTLSVLHEFARESRFPVRIRRNPRNVGSTKNFSQAISLCTGDLIALSDQDDEWHPDKLQAMCRVFSASPRVVAAFSDADLMDANSRPLGLTLWKSFWFTATRKSLEVPAQLSADLLRLDHIATGATMMLRKDFREQCLPIPERWGHDAWISWIAALRCGLSPVPACTMRYRIHEGQQVGLPESGVAQRLRAVRNNHQYFAALALRLKDLRAYLQLRPDGSLPAMIPRIDAKITHLEARAALSSSFWHRTCWIVRSWRDYRLYSRGWAAMLSDAFLRQR